MSVVLHSHQYLSSLVCCIHSCFSLLDVHCKTCRPPTKLVFICCCLLCCPCADYRCSSWLPGYLLRLSGHAGSTQLCPRSNRLVYFYLEYPADHQWLHVSMSAHAGKHALVSAPLYCTKVCAPETMKRFQAQLCLVCQHCLLLVFSLVRFLILHVQSCTFQTP